MTGVLERPGYHIHKIIFESLPEFYVTAKPVRSRQRLSTLPAVLSPCGHAVDSKHTRSISGFLSD